MTLAIDTKVENDEKKYYPRNSLKLLKKFHQILNYEDLLMVFKVQKLKSRYILRKIL